MSIKRVIRQIVMVMAGVMLLTGLAAVGYCAGEEKAGAMLELTRHERETFEEIIDDEIKLANNIKVILKDKTNEKRAEIVGYIHRAVAKSYGYAKSVTFVSADGILYCGTVKKDVSGQKSFKDIKKGSYALALPFVDVLKEKTELINNFYTPVRDKDGKLAGFVSLAYNISDILADIVKKDCGSGILNSYLVNNEGKIISCARQEAYVPDLVKVMNAEADGAGDRLLGQLRSSAEGYFASPYLGGSTIFYSKLDTVINGEQYWIKIVPDNVLNNYQAK